MKVLIIFGTRPEAIKMAPLIKKFTEYKNEFEVKVCVTAQHREMLDQVLDIFDIKPDYDLNIMKKNQDLYDITSSILLNLKYVLDDFTPNLVLVHGDTTTTFSATLASFYKQIPVGHIEAGLRTGDIYSPWPEEINRKLTSQISKYHFAPTIQNKKNLLKEQINENNIVVTGNTVIDALLLMLDKINNNKNIEQQIIKNIEQQLNSKFKIQNSKFILVTGHRRENYGQGFINICESLKEIALKYKDIKIIYPVHLNPNVKKIVMDTLQDIDNIFLINPLQYQEFVYLMSKSYLILTDSGGIQEEAPSLGKPVLVMRNTTERLEAVEYGTVKLVGTNKNKIIDEIEKLLTNKSYYDTISKTENPYGNGKASEKIIGFLRKINL